MDKLMVILNSLDIQFLAILGLVLIIYCAFYFIAVKNQKRVMKKIDESIKRQSEANHQLHLIVNELRRSNRFLAELAEGGPMEEFIEPAPMGQSSTANSSVASAENSQHKLYVGNIDYTATESELADYFSQFGLVEFVNIPVNRYTGKARGFGFVTFSSKLDAENAMALHGTEFKGRQIQVNFAKERELT